MEFEGACAKGEAQVGGIPGASGEGNVDIFRYGRTGGDGCSREVDVDAAGDEHEGENKNNRE
jgi:hypothetical protein